MPKILIEDIQWLRDRIPDIDYFLTKFKPIFDRGGYVAGGFLRRALECGSAIEQLKYQAHDGIRHDVDVFFVNKFSCKSTIEDMQEEFATNPEKKQIMSFKEVGWDIKLGHIRNFESGPNSLMKFAYQTYVTLKGAPDRTIKLQLISAFTGWPEKVLNDFDIANCKIATDGEKVYVREGLEKLMKNNLVEIDSFQDLVPNRVLKYLRPVYMPDGSVKAVNNELTERSKDLLLENLLSRLKSGEWGKLHAPLRNIKKLIEKCDDRAIRTDDIILFMKKLGVVRVYGDEDYKPLRARINLSNPIVKDYAIHQFHQRARNAQS